MKYLNQETKVFKESGNYSKREYWEERFAQEEEFDWLGKLSDFEHLLNLSPNSTVLVLGCGNSKLSTELRNKGHFVISTDYSNNVCQKQKMVTGLEYSGLAFSSLSGDLRWGTSL